MGIKCDKQEGFRQSPIVSELPSKNFPAMCIALPQPLVSHPLSRLKSNTQSPIPLSPLSKMSYVPNVVSQSLEFSCPSEFPTPMY